MNKFQNQRPLYNPDTYLTGQQKIMWTPTSNIQMAQKQQQQQLFQCHMA